MIENNYYSDNQELVDFFENVIDWDVIVDAYENDFSDHKEYARSKDEKLMYAPSTVAEAVEMYQLTLASVGEISGTYIAPRAAKMDETGLEFKDGKVEFPTGMIESFEKMKEAGLIAYGMARKYGGIGQGSIVTSMQSEIMSRADGAFAISIGCVNLAETIERFGDPDTINEWVPKMAAGDLFGAMALTEPNYGSDLPGVQTKAVKDEKGNWKLTGTKRFITHGCGFADMPAAVLTLARTGSSSSGAKGLSFFLVNSNDIEVAGIEKKLGLHCSPTCEIVYEDSPGILLGQEGYGLIRCAMGMMNTARLSIASQSLGIAVAAQSEAHKYASEREQFGKLIQDIPAVRKMLDLMDREVFAMRCLMYESAKSVDMYYWKTIRMEHDGISSRDIRKDEIISKWEKLANFFTPLAKYYNSEICNSIAFDAIQIHGGSGFTEEYDSARIYRDARITNIYEGTTQMQVHAIIGGASAGMSAKGHLRAYIDEEMSNIKASSELGELREYYEKAVESYKRIQTSEKKEFRAFELVENAARFINGLLMEKATSKMPGQKQDKYRAMCMDYHLDSKAIMQGNLLKLDDMASKQQK